jgi:CBS domain containing-hemolysin-like protein
MISITLVLQILLLLFLVGVNAFFAASEIAVISLNDRKVEKMAEDGDKKAKILLKLILEYNIHMGKQGGYLSLPIIRTISF